jgi:hypothetical protein
MLWSHHLMNMNIKNFKPAEDDLFRQITEEEIPTLQKV